jgi:tRNA (guanine-N7-)-methyltransferase
MKINYTYRMYGRSKGRGKNNEITNDAISIKIKKIDPLKYNIIDIGAGYGESTLAISKTDSGKQIIACEKFIDGINKIAEKSFLYSANNISIFHGNFHQLLDEYCPNNSISEIWILFPDPWPKKRHFKRRLINVNFFNKITDFLKKDAKIHIASDSKSYISDILLSIHQVKADFKWLNQNKDEWDYLNMTLPQTKYFQKALKRGFNPMYLKLIKY